MNNYSVNVFWGKDKTFRFVPGIRNRFGVYVPIPEGREISFSNNYEEIGHVYLQTAQKALNHLGEDLDMRKAKPKYISFKGFKSQNDFDLKHFLISSIAKNDKINFTFTVWHKNEFCLYKNDPICSKEIPYDSSAKTIGLTIFAVLEMAQKSFPELDIFSNKKYIIETPILPINSTTIYAKGIQGEHFINAIRNISSDVTITKFKAYDVFSDNSTNCFIENDIHKLFELSKLCSDMYCFSAYSVVGFYGFFHYVNGECVRAYASLDEDGSIPYNLGKISEAEMILNLNLPRTSEQFSECVFDNLNFSTLQDIAECMLK